MSFTEEKYNEMVAEIHSNPSYRKPIAFGVCKVEYSKTNPLEVIGCRYLSVSYMEDFDQAAIMQDAAKIIDFTKSERVIVLDEKMHDLMLMRFHPFAENCKQDISSHEHVRAMLCCGVRGELTKARVEQARAQFKAKAMTPDETQEFLLNPYHEFRMVFLYEDADVQSVETAYLKLFLKSMNLADDLDIDDVDDVLPVVGWCNGRPVDLEWLRRNRMDLIAHDQYPSIERVSKSPRYLDHIVPRANMAVGRATPLGSQAKDC